jgi:hypothetical protein
VLLAGRERSRRNRFRRRTRWSVLEGLGALAGLVWPFLLAPSFASAGAPAHPDTSSAHFSPSAARRLETKLQILSGTPSSGSSSARPVVITENEANSYLHYHAGDFFPPGVDNPAIRILPGGVYGAADVDFEEFARTNPNPKDWGPKVLAAMFKGKQRVVAIGRLMTQDGEGTLKIETVSIGKSKVPDWLVDFIVENYLQPRYHFDLSKPFPLPDHVMRIQLNHGKATFVRSPQKTR